MRAGYTEVGDDLGAGPQQTPQILVSGISPRTGENEGGFVSDVALFVGGEPFAGFSGVVEIHFVGNSLDPVLTEAKVAWELTGEEAPAAFRETLDGGELARDQWGVAAELRLSRSFLVHLAWLRQEESRDAPRLDDDALTGGLVFEF